MAGVAVFIDELSKVVMNRSTLPCSILQVRHLDGVLSCISPVDVPGYPVYCNSFRKPQVFFQEYFIILPVNVGPFDDVVRGVGPVDLTLHAVNVNTSSNLGRLDIDRLGPLATEGDFEDHHALSHQHEVPFKSRGWLALKSIPKEERLAATPAGIGLCRDAVTIGVADGRVEEAGGGGGAVVAVTYEAPHRVTVTVVSPLRRVKLTPCKPPAVVDDITANLGLLLAAVSVTEVAGTAPRVNTKSVDFIKFHVNNTS